MTEPPDFPSGQDIIMPALGQVWHFSPASVRALSASAKDPAVALKAFIIHFSSAQGLSEGLHQVHYREMEFSLQVQGEQVTVER